MPHYISIKKAAEILDVSTKTIDRRIRSGKLKAYRFGNKTIRINEDAIQDLLEPIETADSIYRAIKKKTNMQ